MSRTMNLELGSRLADPTCQMITPSQIIPLAPPPPPLPAEALDVAPVSQASVPAISLSASLAGSTSPPRNLARAGFAAARAALAAVWAALVAAREWTGRVAVPWGARQGNGLLNGLDLLWRWTKSAAAWSWSTALNVLIVSLGFIETRAGNASSRLVRLRQDGLLRQQAAAVELRERSHS